MQAYIVMVVMVLMIIAFVLNKWSFGLITLSCCAILGITGVLGPDKVFSGFANPFVVMLAGCFVVTYALGKTNFIRSSSYLLCNHGIRNDSLVLEERIKDGEKSFKSMEKCTCINNG